MTDIFFDSLILGAVAGLSAGLFGIGGGLIIVPVLAWLFSVHGFDQDRLMIMAVATSLATIILTSIASVSAHHRLGSVPWRRVFLLAPGIMIGAAMGSVLADSIDAAMLRTIFIVYLIAAAVQLAVEASPKPGRLGASKSLDIFFSVMVGLMSALLGIGGGTLIVPYLVFFRMPMRNAVAVSSACGISIALTGTASYALLGQKAANLPQWSVGYVYLPAFLGIVMASIFTALAGAKLANIIPARRLKRYFSLLLVVIAAKMIWY